MKLSERERQRLYGCIHEAVMRARIRVASELPTNELADKIDRAIADITEAAFRPYVDGVTK